MSSLWFCCLQEPEVKGMLLCALPWTSQAHLLPGVWRLRIVCFSALSEIHRTYSCCSWKNPQKPLKATTPHFLGLLVTGLV